MNPLRLLSRTALFNVRRSLDRPRVMPLSLILSMTHKCLARCKTCSIWKIYITDPEEEATELTLAEWEKVFAGLGTSTVWFTLSGGNQFLREDFPGIVESLMRQCKPELVNIPVSGLDPDKVKDRIHDIVAAAEQHQVPVAVNLSMDGLKAKHDHIRGTKGDFSNTVDTFHTLDAMRHNHPLLSLGVYSVISSMNVEDVPQICDFVTSSLKPDSYTVEIAEPRDEFNISNRIVPDLEKYQKAVDYVHHKAPVHRRDFTHRLKGALRRRYHEIIRKQLETGKAEIPCFAGVASAQITPHGTVWSCCTTIRELGDLKQNDYDFKQVWFSRQARHGVEDIRDTGCFCTHSNVYYTNILCNVTSLAKVALDVVLPGGAKKVEPAAQPVPALAPSSEAALAEVPAEAEASASSKRRLPVLVGSGPGDSKS